MTQGIDVTQGIDAYQVRYGKYSVGFALDILGALHWEQNARIEKLEKDQAALTKAVETLAQAVSNLNTQVPIDLSTVQQLQAELQAQLDALRTLRSSRDITFEDDTEIDGTPIVRGYLTPPR